MGSIQLIFTKYGTYSRYPSIHPSFPQKNFFVQALIDFKVWIFSALFQNHKLPGEDFKKVGRKAQIIETALSICALRLRPTF